MMQTSIPNKKTKRRHNSQNSNTQKGHQSHSSPSAKKRKATKNPKRKSQSNLNANGSKAYYGNTHNPSNRPVKSKQSSNKPKKQRTPKQKEALKARRRKERQARMKEERNRSLQKTNSVRKPSAKKQEAHYKKPKQLKKEKPEKFAKLGTKTYASASVEKKKASRGKSKPLRKKEREDLHSVTYPLWAKPNINHMFWKDIGTGILFFIGQMIVSILIGTATIAGQSLIPIILAFIVGGVLCVQAIKTARKRSIARQGWEPTKLSTALIGAVGIQVAIITVSFLMQSLGVQLVSQPNQQSINELMSVQFIPMVFFTVLLAPIVEELVFREYLPTAFGSSIIAYGLSGLLFLFLHQPSGLIGWAIYTVMTTGFIWMKIKSNNTVQSMVGHSIYNGVGILLIILGV